MKVPLSKPYVDKEMKDRVLDVIDSGQYILGNQCKDFEKEFAQFIGVKHAVLTSSGTSAIFLCLKALGVGKGDGILVPSLTAFPTIEPVFHVGARPIFIDIDDTYTVDPKHIESVLRKKSRIRGVKQIRGMIPVHLYGHPAQMDSLRDLAKRYGLFILEDCCQAHGARFQGARVGSMGIGGCFSFYPSKNLTVFGDGGILVTSDDEMAKTCRMLRDHGRKEKYEHELVGYNLRFNEIQGAVGRLQLKRLDWFNESRRRIAGWYNEGLKGTPVVTPRAKDWAEAVYHLYVIQTDQREKLADFLKEKGVQSGIHYPIPNHQQPAVRNALGQQPKLEVTEVTVQKILSLPIYPELEKEKVDFVCASIREFFDQKN
ncbi:MAG TPA: DegT/DnrJ/EryC1/StrS family aminotransferase [Thermodesulfobacteriota bacterium]|nr:DegT/DnrJ/EryC1/StrS family aminotransferase [Thermodesulfobacteriota bacterium]